MSESKTTGTRFAVGDVVRHKRFDYRGVVVGIDPEFQGTDEWYETVARSRPPKDRPWYRVLPHGAEHQTYVADRNLELDNSRRPIEHPLTDVYFTHFIGGRYVNGRMN
jgi:heat shock protein HspQ